MPTATQQQSSNAQQTQQETAPQGQQQQNQRRWFAGYRMVICDNFAGFFYLSMDGRIHSSPPGMEFWVGKHFNQWRVFAKRKYKFYLEGKGHDEYMAMLRQVKEHTIASARQTSAG